MKRFFAVLFATVLVGQVWAANYDFKSEDLYYKIVDQSTVQLVGSDTYKKLVRVIIPETVTYKKKNYTVVRIDDNAFSNCRVLEYVSIPVSVISIGGKAFEKCMNLKKAEFASIESFCQIKFEEAASSYPLFYANHLYINGKEITELIIPNSVTSINDRAFCGCSNIKSVIIPNSVKSIGEYAFEGCTNLISVTIPNTVSEICEGTFRKCSNLLLVDIPNSISKIGNSAFYGCEILADVKIPNSVKEIGTAAFGRCNIKTLNIPSSVEKIGVNAFISCQYLTQVNIPASVKIIGKDAFSDCPKIKNIYCEVEEKPSGWDTYWIADKRLSDSFSRNYIIKWGNGGNATATANQNKTASFSYALDQLSENGVILVGRWYNRSVRIQKDSDSFLLIISLHDDIEWPLDGKYLIILGEDYVSFEKNMAIVNEKYTKWTQTAKKDGEINFRKTIVDFGDRIGRMSLFQMIGTTKLYAVFEVDKNGNCLLKLGSQEIDDSEYAYSNYEPYYTFNSPEDFRRFYEIIKYDNAMKNYEIMKAKVDAKKKARDARDAKFD